MMKKTLSVLLAAVLIVLTPAVGFAGDMKWSYDEENALVSVSGYGIVNDGSFLTPYLNKIKKIELKKGVTAIEKNVFSNCGTVEEVVLPEGFLTIGENSFGFCKYLKKINLPDSLKTIGNEAFMGCVELEEVVIPKNVSYIGTNSFADCEKTESFYVSEENEHYTSVDGVIFSKDKTELIMYPPGRKDESYTVPSGTVKIAEKAFSYNLNLKKVSMPEGLSQIGSYAFYFCENLKDAELAASVKEIGDYAFYGSAIKNVFVAYGCEKIGEGAFKNCSSLVLADVPGTVSDIGKDAFYGAADSFKIRGYSAAAQQCAADGGNAFEQTVRISVNETELRPERPAYVQNGCTMVPMRSIFEALKADVSWDGETQSAVAKKGETVCRFAIGDKFLYKNDEAVELLAPAQINEGRTLVHVRAVAEAFGEDVSWNQDTGLVIIQTP